MFMTMVGDLVQLSGNKYLWLSARESRVQFCEIK
jgi:hypothetical protein